MRQRQIGTPISEEHVAPPPPSSRLDQEVCYYVCLIILVRKGDSSHSLPQHQHQLPSPIFYYCEERGNNFLYSCGACVYNWMFINTAVITSYFVQQDHTPSLAQMFPKQRERATDGVRLLQILMIYLMSEYESRWSTLKLSQFDVRTDRVWFADLLAMDDIYLLTICYHPRHEQCYSTQPITKIDFSEPMKGLPLVPVARITMRGSLWWNRSSSQTSDVSVPNG